MANGAILGQKTIVLNGTTSIPITGWTDNTSTTGYYTISITVNGILPTDIPSIGIEKSFTDSDADDLMQQAWNLIQGAAPLTNGFQFYTLEVPTTTIAIQWEVVR